ncbi:hypothetical protein ALC56_13028 [Trachymyrmex septentrionalis]|uniref:Uncharacterized protein n=1 Tax=Trachymyrmex septentrionalis TaxID=34720 RepID=A0A151JTP2_9HYME|nr:hypothetical protein ALC56_13028 [Trachymyrmex septentrionalis]
MLGSAVVPGGIRDSTSPMSMHRRVGRDAISQTLTLRRVEKIHLATVDTVHQLYVTQHTLKPKRILKIEDYQLKIRIQPVGTKRIKEMIIWSFFFGTSKIPLLNEGKRNLIHPLKIFC